MNKTEAIKRLREALEFYADPKTSAPGATARQALLDTAAIVPVVSAAKIFTPMQRNGTLIHQGRDGGFGFDVGGCPDAEELAAFIVMACNAYAFSAPEPAAVPEEVRQALDRMCTPLHQSRLAGMTAQEDARCMAIIKAYIESAAAPVPPVAAVQDELDWTRPIETMTGRPATLVWPYDGNGCAFVTLDDSSGRWSYKPNGTPSDGQAFNPTLRNARAAQSAPVPPSVQVPDIVPWEERMATCQDVTEGDRSRTRRHHMIDELSEHRAFIAQLKGKK